MRELYVGTWIMRFAVVYWGITALTPVHCTFCDDTDCYSSMRYHILRWLVSKLYKDFFPFLSLTSFYLLIVGIEGYCCTWSHWVTHTRARGRTPLNERSVRRGDLNLRTRNSGKRKTSIPPAEIEPAVEQSQTHALDRAATSVGMKRNVRIASVCFSHIPLIPTDNLCLYYDMFQMNCPTLNRTILLLLQ